MLFRSPDTLDVNEPGNLARTIAQLKLNYVVITSVTRDDLPDGGAEHWYQTVLAVRAKTGAQIEVLTPDFKGNRAAVTRVIESRPDVFNHNLETAPRLYRKARPGANYKWSLELLKKFKEQHPDVPTKSGLMMGLGETKEEIIEVLKDLRAHGVTMLTLGQYLAPSRHHLPVERYVPPSEFDELKEVALELGFTHAACGPFVRSSYHADMQAQGIEIK